MCGYFIPRYFDRVSYPTISVVQHCQSEGNCQTEQATVSMDSNWRWIHEKGGYTNCYTGNEWDQSICPDSATCTQNCVLGLSLVNHV